MVEDDNEEEGAKEEEEEETKEEFNRLYTTIRLPRKSAMYRLASSTAISYICIVGKLYTASCVPVADSFHDGSRTRNAINISISIQCNCKRI